MEWTQALTIIGVNVTITGILAGFMIYFFNKIHGDIDRLDRRLDGHATRIDQLYTMFCDMQKEIKDIYKDWSKERIKGEK